MLKWTSTFNIVWKYPFYDINIWNVKLFEFACFYYSKGVGNGIKSENDCFSSFNFEKKFHKVCNTMALYISCFLLHIVSTIFENI